MDDYPILMEGIHCSFLLKDNRFQKRRLFLRLHNVEHIYYHHLARSTRSVFQKLYFNYESKALFKYEKSIARAVTIIAVSEHDELYYRKHFNADRISYLPVFLPWQNVEADAGKGQFCLYHGNLSVIENEVAALWLLCKVFRELKTPFVIAGRNPTPRLQQAVKGLEHVCLVANPSEGEMQDLIKKAHINILPAFNTTGVKLKLLSALFLGRHCITNKLVVQGTELEGCCHVVSKGAEATATSIQKPQTRSCCCCSTFAATIMQRSSWPRTITL